MIKGNRKCRFCGRHDGETRQCVWPFSAAMLALGLTLDRNAGDHYAHPKCLRKAQEKHEQEKSR